jgi:Helix-turn-helix domain
MRWRNAIRDADLPARATLVGLAVATWMNRDGHAFPSQSTIARACGLSVRTVQKATRELEAKGLLDVQRSTGRRSHRYQAIVPVEAESPVGTSHPTRGSSDETRTSAQSTSQSGAPNREPGSHESIGSLKESVESGLSYISSCYRCDHDFLNADLDENYMCSTCRATSPDLSPEHQETLDRLIRRSDDSP